MRAPTRHVELDNGTVMPFSRGASFYKVNDQGRICKARDLVEALPKVDLAALRVELLWNNDLAACQF